jgi:adenosylcobinamide kinase/adenosylcobinamide-phosphate guanylyltransferase
VAIILIGGGARSGKSRYALEKARGIAGTHAFVATAQALDDEMSTRIRLHQEDRGDDFTTIEEPIELARAITGAKFDVLVVDCLTLWLSNIMFAKQQGGTGAFACQSTFSEACDHEIDALVEASRTTTQTVIFVTNEVGSGIIPTDHALARDFRDRAGILNQRIAAIADEVYFMVFGQPLRVK